MVIGGDGREAGVQAANCQGTLGPPAPRPPPTQVARLKMELSLASKARDDLETKVTELETSNMTLRAEVANSQLAMKSTLEEAIRLLQSGGWGGGGGKWVGGVE